ncbi:MAG TPA: 23S rRNA (uracil(1939)-C(5))-methyltransferase RlmD, partial [Solirubrobacterales bacterium]|nr:23S rRNA (uracil(1939)-C(5))-methyltransferase RlmD [Solirubrobacterales bacterium]
MEGATGTSASAARGPRRGDLLELEIDSLAFGGRGVARAEVTKAKKRFAEARVVELLSPGPERVADVCLHGGEPCPGAPWQGLPYERQLAYKQEQVKDALTRLGGLEGFELEEIVPAVEQWRYRNKLEYSFGESEEGEVTLGFHARGRWDLTVDVEDCHLSSEAGNEARNAVREWAR